MQWERWEGFAGKPRAWPPGQTGTQGAAGGLGPPGDWHSQAQGSGHVRAVPGTPSEVRGPVAHQLTRRGLKGPADTRQRSPERRTQQETCVCVLYTAYRHGNYGARTSPHLPPVSQRPFLDAVSRKEVGGLWFSSSPEAPSAREPTAGVPDGRLEKSTCPRSRGGTGRRENTSFLRLPC